MIATTINESKRLLACGVKAETADMTMEVQLKNIGGCKCVLPVRLIADSPLSIDTYNIRYKEPAWSLFALMTKVLPACIDKEVECELEVGVFENQWYCKYSYSDIETWAGNPIVACVKMAELLHEKKLI